MTLSHQILSKEEQIKHLRELAEAHGYYLMKKPPNKISEEQIEKRLSRIGKQKKLKGDDHHFVIDYLKTMGVRIHGLFEFYNKA